MFKRWLALFTGLITFQEIRVRETNCVTQWIEIYPLDIVVQPWFEQLHPAGQLKLGISSKTNDLVTCESSFLFIASTFSITSFPPT